MPDDRPRPSPWAFAVGSAASRAAARALLEQRAAANAPDLSIVFVAARDGRPDPDVPPSAPMLVRDLWKM